MVWQLQFADIVDVGGARVGQKVSEALEAGLEDTAHLTKLAPTTVTLALGPMAVGAAPPQPQPSGDPAFAGWQIRIRELVATVAGGALTVETTNFQDWPRFSSAIRALLAGFNEGAVVPQGEQRLGLRYVDRIWRPEIRVVQDWVDWVQPWLLGALTQRELAPAVTALAQQIDCDAGDGMRATIRQRVFEDAERRGRPTMLLDFDIFRDGYRSFDEEEALQATEKLNDVAHRLFRAAITTRLLDALTQEPELR